MFQKEFYGYKQSEVEDYIKRLKTTYEAKLMAEKLKVLESEKQLMDSKANEKKLMNAFDVLDKQTKFQEEGSKRIYGLVINKLELLVNELNEKYPQLLADKEYEKIFSELDKIVESFKNGTLDGKTLFRPISQENDSMRVLLMKMQEHKKEQAKPEKTETAQKEPEKENSREYVSPLTIPDNGSGFNFAEAINPTMPLEEIMKAFDFYGN